MLSSDKILSDLARHRGMFRLSENGLGEALLKAAVDGVKAAFDACETPDGAEWPELSSAYAAEKARLFPGMPMGVRTGLLKSELDGEPAISDDTATWTMGTSDQGRDEAVWMHQKGRGFAGLTDSSRSASRDILDHHFKDQS